MSPWFEKPKRKQKRGEQFSNSLGWEPEHYHILSGVGLYIAITIISLVILSAIITLFIGRGNSVQPEVQFPTAVSTIVAPTQVRIWSEHQMLNQQQAAQLRQERNVVHLAFLGQRGSIQYSAINSVAFNEETWTLVRTRPAQISTITPRGTSVIIDLSDEQFPYTINTLQPFVMLGRNVDTTIYIVDLQGRLWQISTSEAPLTSVAEVQQTLPQELSPNANLSLTF